MYSVHPSAGERFFLRLLLIAVPGPTSFEDLRTHDGIVHPTFRDACIARGLTILSLVMWTHDIVD